jgi:hypothetical protein
LADAGDGKWDWQRAKKWLRVEAPGPVLLVLENTEEVLLGAAGQQVGANVYHSCLTLLVGHIGHVPADARGLPEAADNSYVWSFARNSLSSFFL